MAVLAPVGWTLVALIVFVGNFATLLDLPDRVQDLSPLSHLAQMPVEDFAPLPAAMLAAAGVTGLALGLVGLRRREVGVR